ncbi:cytochrome c oxidase assembly factor Coa1 family protein [uncultured Flavobacterium sp.]|uniref:cytochrome c oxidase assembly factor Coa1 family protein n=1 Tax=uncultured Flavobacterium sp. TaxID=165435 RepID=UPI002930D829|nr:cytochrome c oxidase assembly factor Coa1 family protein [uncultured Flavobacterium sp.]
MKDSYNDIRKSWWDRNWKWLVPTGCVSLLILLCLFIAGVFFGVTSMMKESDVYKEVMTEVQHNNVIIEKLGSPIEEEGMASGNISLSNDTGNCDLQIPIKGSKGEGTIFVVAEKRGTWKYSVKQVYIVATKENINLLKK